MILHSLLAIAILLAIILIGGSLFTLYVACLFIQEGWENGTEG